MTHPLPPGNTNLFIDSIVCGVIGGGIAALFSRQTYLWAMLCALTGPLFILLTSRAVRALPPSLPGRHSGTYEFAAFALCVAILAAIGPFSR